VCAIFSIRVVGCTRAGHATGTAVIGNRSCSSAYPTFRMNLSLCLALAGNISFTGQRKYLV